MSINYKILGVMLLVLNMILVANLDSVIGQDDTIFIQGSPANIKQTCHNNGTLCSSVALCNITVFDPRDVTLVDNERMTQSSELGFFNFTLQANQTGLVGTYFHEVTCSDINPTSSNFAREPFQVRAGGIAPSIADILLYGLLFLGFLGIFLLTLFGYFRLDFKRKTDIITGQYKLRWEKYTKLFLLFLVYLQILFMLFVTWKSSETLIFLDFMSPLLYFFYILWLVIAAPMMTFIFVLTYVFVFTDKKLQKAVVRGVPLR